MEGGRLPGDTQQNLLFTRAMRARCRTALLSKLLQKQSLDGRPIPVAGSVFLAAAVSTSDDDINGSPPCPVHSNHEDLTAPETPRNQSEGHVQVREEA